MPKVAFITGINGQDGSYLAEFLLNKGYEVHGLLRRSSSSLSTWRLEQITQGRERLWLRFGDLTDSASLRRHISEVAPDEIYNLAAQSDVGISFQVAEQTASVTGLGALRMLEAVRDCCATARFYQASSSEMFGKSPPPQNEKTPFHPRSPYGCAKAYAHYMTVNYREAYGIFAVSGILFNHESPRRGENFVTRKITKAVAAIEAGQQQELHLGNLAARRDWGFAGDYVRAMWQMMQAPEPQDFVIGTGQAHSVEEFCELAFAEAGLNWRDYVRSDSSLVRPAEVDNLVADYSKAASKLGWEPKISFQQLVADMVRSDREQGQADRQKEAQQDAQQDAKQDAQQDAKQDDMPQDRQVVSDVSAEMGVSADMNGAKSDLNDKGNLNAQRDLVESNGAVQATEFLG